MVVPEEDLYAPSMEEGVSQSALLTHEHIHACIPHRPTTTDYGLHALHVCFHCENFVGVRRVGAQNIHRHLVLHYTHQRLQIREAERVR